MSNKIKLSIFWVGIVLAFILYLYVRWPLLNFEDSFKYLSSDHAIFIMMGEDIKTLTHFPFFYWGGTYLGPFANAFMALVQIIADALGIVHTLPTNPEVRYIISPLTAVISTSLLQFFGYIFFGLGFLRFFSVWETLLAIFILCLGNWLLVLSSLRPLGPEVVLCLGGVLFWRGLCLIENNNKWNQLLYGFLFGFSWWMNQTVVFVIAPLLYYFVSKTEEFKGLRSNLKIKDRFLLRLENLNLKPIPKGLKYFLHFLYFIALLNLLMGIYISIIGEVNGRYFGIKLKILNGFGPIKSSSMIFIGTQFLLWFFKDSSEQSKRIIKENLIKLKYFLIGLAIGYGPVVLGKWLKWYPPGYGPTFKFVPAKHVIGWWQTLLTNFLPDAILSKETIIILPFSILILISLSIAIVSHYKTIKDYLLAKFKQHPTSSLLWMIAGSNLIYIAFADRTRTEFAHRYAILIIPVISIFCVSCWRFFSSRYKFFGVLTAMSLSLLLAEGFRREGTKFLMTMKNTESLVDKMKILHESECEVFHSNYWNSYVYEYYMQKTKRFIVERGQDRTPLLTGYLKNLNAKHCDLNEATFEIKKMNF